MLFDFFRNRSKDAPTFWLDYLDSFAIKRPNSTPVSELEFVIFDTETTGLNPSVDRILSIGAVKLTRGEMDVGNSLESYLEQTTFNKEAILIHGLLPKGKEIKKEESKAVEEFVTYIGNAILIAHNAQFDVGIINASLKKMGCGRLKNKVLDTAKLAIRADGITNSQQILASNYTLDALCDKYMIKKSQRHTATGDAFMTAVLLMKLLKRLELRGIKTLKDLFRRMN